MIEHSYVFNGWTGESDAYWSAVTPDLEVFNTQFKAFHYRINGVVYTEDSKEFREAFEKERFWEKLSD